MINGVLENFSMSAPNEVRSTWNTFVTLPEGLFQTSTTSTSKLSWTPGPAVEQSTDADVRQVQHSDRRGQQRSPDEGQDSSAAKTVNPWS